MNAVFADTSFYLALLRADDALHSRALAESRINRPILTAEFVLVELGNACSRAADHADFLALVAGMRASPRITTIPLSTLLLNRGLHLMAERPDKDWSLTDCISFIVMQDHGVKSVLTADHHFRQAGFTTLLSS